VTRFSAFAAALCLVLPAAAQTPPLSFEVASIKINHDTGSTNMSINDSPGGRLDCSNVTLRMLLSFAYNLRDYQLVNLPGWADTERYDIAAKPSPEAEASEPPSNSPAFGGRLRERTRALLAERFTLKTHEESREMSIYSLVVAKGGAKLQPTTSDRPTTSWNNTRVICRKVTMERFAQVLLSSRMGRMVIDNTGLTGEYDFTLQFQPDETVSKPGVVATTPAPAQEGPSFLTALEEQLGLKLVATRSPVPFLVIDHVEKASAN